MKLEENKYYRVELKGSQNVFHSLIYTMNSISKHTIKVLILKHTIEHFDLILTIWNSSLKENAVAIEIEVPN